MDQLNVDWISSGEYWLNINWPSNNWQMTSKELSIDCSMTVDRLSNDCQLNIAWLSTDFQMTIDWLSTDYRLTIKWLSTVFQMTIDWLSNDYRLTIEWLYQLTFNWLSTDYRLTIDWLSTDYNRLTIKWNVVRQRIYWLVSSQSNWNWNMLLIRNATSINISFQGVANYATNDNAVLSVF